MKNGNKRQLRVLRMNETVKRTGYSRGSIYRLMAEEKFPKQIKLGARAIGWIESDVEAWILSKVSITTKEN